MKTGENQNTPQELEGLRTFPIKSDLIVWIYYINDIEAASVAHGNSPHVDLRIASRWLRLPVENSYFLNFVYWRWFRLLGRLESYHYWKSFQTFYDDEAIWSTHRLELEAVAKYAGDHNIPLVVVIFPSLTDVGGSKKVTAKVANVFRVEGVPVIDLADYLAGRDPQSMIVSTVDSHPNVALNREVANLILAELKTRGFLEPAASSERHRSKN